MQLLVTFFLVRQTDRRKTTHKSPLRMGTGGLKNRRAVEKQSNGQTQLQKTSFFIWGRVHSGGGPFNNRQITVSGGPISFELGQNGQNIPFSFRYRYIHRFTYPKGVHSYRYFLQPMHTPNSLPPAHAYSTILLLPTHTYMQLDLYAYTLTV